MFRRFDVVTLLVFLILTGCRKPASHPASKPSQPPIYLQESETLDDVLTDIYANDADRAKAKKIVSRAGEQWCNFLTQNHDQLHRLLDDYRAATASGDDAKAKQIRAEHTALVQTLPMPKTLWPQVKESFPAVQRAQLDALWSKKNGADVADLLVGRELHDAVKKLDTQPDVTGSNKQLCVSCHLPRERAGQQ